MRNFLVSACLLLTSFSAKSYDLAISPTLVAPASGCYLSSMSTVTIIIANVTATPFAGTIDITYVLNGGAPVTESITTFLPASGTYIYSFITKANLSACQSHSFIFSIALSSDVNLANNVFTTNVISDCDAVAGSITYPDTVCSGINSGNLLLSGYNGNISNWAFSDTGLPPFTWTGNSTSSQPYTNITVPQTWKCVVTSPFGYCLNDTTTLITIQVSPQSNPGTLPADFLVCDNGNSGQIDLTGYTGTILDWEYSDDGGTTWNSLGNATDSLDYLNIVTTTQYHVIVQSNFCPAATSSSLTLTVVPGTNPGILPADFNVCDNGNSGTIDLTGYLGNILYWEYSTDGGATWNNISNTTPSQSYSNLTTPTSYQVWVQNSFCNPEVSNIITLNIIPGTNPGSIVGPNVVCHYVNDTMIEVNPILGSVVDWIYSIDNGITWTSTGVTDTIYSFVGLNDLTVFGAVVQEGTCYKDTTFHTIVIMPIGITAGPDVTIVEGQSTQLIGYGGVGYEWFPTTGLSDPFINSPSASPLITTQYSVQVTDINGCMDTAFVTVTVTPLVVFTAIVIPNLITPNGDGFNDEFKIQNIDLYPQNELTIFNQYGQVVFQSSTYTNDWSGTYNGDALPDGTYFYILDLNDSSLAQEVYQGNVTILGN